MSGARISLDMMKNKFRVLVGKPEEKRPFWGPSTLHGNI
jgi:hypothetical protein